MRTVETPSALGWRRTLSQLYRTIAAVETSPMEILFDRVLQLEQEVSALKRNLLIGSVDHEMNRLGPAITAAARRDSLG
jgi:hypothetical protein